MEGISGQPGVLVSRLQWIVEGTNTQRDWTKHKLVAIDTAKLTFSCSIVDGNVGFHSYVSTVTVATKEEEDECSIEWSYEVEPVEGWTSKDLDSFVGTGLQVMASKMEAALQDYFKIITQ